MKTLLSHARIAGALLSICTVVALLLASVNLLTRDVIAENTRREKEAAIAALYPSFSQLSERAGEYPSGVNAVYEVYEGTRVSGYTVDLTVAGFGGDMNMMVAVRADGSCGGVRVIRHSETAGLGSRATEADYLAAYVGQSGAPLLGEDIDAVSGATISSRAVQDGVTLALSLGLGGDAA